MCTLLLIFPSLTVAAPPCEEALLKKWSAYQSEFKKNGDQLAHELQAELQFISEQLALPANKRDLKDDRLFSRFRDQKLNPASLFLNARQKLLESVQARLTSNEALVKDIENLQLDLASEFGSETENFKLSEWTLSRAGSVLEQEFKKINESVSASTYEAFQRSNQKFAPLPTSEYLTNALEDFYQLKNWNSKWKEDGYSEVYLKYFEALKKDALADVETHLKKFYKPGFGPDLKTRLYEIKLIHSSFYKDIDQLAEDFSQIYQEVQTARKGLFLDIDAANLLHTRALYKISNQEVINRFLELDRLARASKKSYAVLDKSLQILTDASFRLKIEPQALIDRFFALEKIGSENKAKYAIKQEALVALAIDLCRENCSEVEMAQKLYTLYDLNKGAPKSFTINSLGTSLLLEGLEHHQTLEELSKLFSETKSILEQNNLNTIALNDEDVSRFCVLSLKTKILPEVLAENAALIEKTLNGFGVAHANWRILVSLIQTRGSEFLASKITTREIVDAYHQPPLAYSDFKDLEYETRAETKRPPSSPSISGGGRNNDQGHSESKSSGDSGNFLSTYNFISGGGMDDNILTPW